MRGADRGVPGGRRPMRFHLPAVPVSGPHLCPRFSFKSIRSQEECEELMNYLGKTWCGDFHKRYWVICVGEWGRWKVRGWCMECREVIWRWRFHDRKERG